MTRILALAAAGLMLGGCVTTQQLCEYRPLGAIGLNLLGTQVEIGPEARADLKRGADVFCPPAAPAKASRAKRAKK